MEGHLNPVSVDTLPKVADKSNQKLIVLLVALVAILLTVIGALTYQNQQLKKQLLTKQEETDNLQRSPSPILTPPTVTSFSTPIISNSNPIRIKVRNLFYADEIKAFWYKFSFDREAGEIVKLIPANYQGQEFYDRIEITRGGTTLTIQPVFEGVSVPYYGQKPEVYQLPSTKISAKPVHRIKNKETTGGYFYVNDYAEGEGCKQWSPQPIACHMSNLSLEKGEGLVISCQAAPETVANCDRLIMSLTVTVSEIDENSL